MGEGRIPPLDCSLAVIVEGFRRSHERVQAPARFSVYVLGQGRWSSIAGKVEVN